MLAKTGPSCPVLIALRPDQMGCHTVRYIHQDTDTQALQNLKQLAGQSIRMTVRIYKNSNKDVQISTRSCGFIRRRQSNNRPLIRKAFNQNAKAQASSTSAALHVA
jgi:hypothetical protein